MGKINGEIARISLCDAADALLFECQGIAVSFCPPKSNITFNTDFNGFELKLKIYGRKNKLSYVFFVDHFGDYIGSGVWEGESQYKTNLEEDSVLEDVYQSLYEEGYLDNDKAKKVGV